MDTDISFENIIQKASEIIEGRPDFPCVKSATIVRNIHGQVALAIEFIQSPSESVKSEWDEDLREKLGEYYSSIIWDTQDENPVIEYIAERREPLLGCPKNIYYVKIGIAKLSWLQSKPKQWIWKLQDTKSNEAPKPFVATFYSFKGGMGRTTTLAGIALCLAKKGKRVAVVDLDLEAPGVADVFLPPPDPQGAPTIGVLDYCLQYGIGCAQPTIDKAALRLDGNDGKIGSVYIVPAGVVNAAYVEKLACLDLQQENEVSLKTALLSLLEIVANDTRADYILLDSRAGFHEIAGIALSSFSHAAILFGNTASQSMAGIFRAVSLIANYNTDDSLADERPFLAFVHGLARNTSESAGVKDNGLYRDKLYDVCIDSHYYESEDNVPNLTSKEADHEPFIMSFQDRLREGIRITEDIENTQYEGIVEVLTTGEYMRLAERICKWREE